MNEGMKIVLERMDTNPEEFIDNSKWEMIIHRHLEYLSDEDRKAFNDKMGALKSERFTAEVIKELMRDEEQFAITPSVGTVRYNINTNMAELYDGKGWIPAILSTGGGGGGITYSGAGGGSFNQSMTIVKRKE
jgi:hypothetical protein